MNRVVAPEISTFYQRRHEHEGVRILCNMSVSSFSGVDRVQGRPLRRPRVPGGSRDRRRRHPARVDARGFGRPRCENGIWVDEHCQTSDPNIYAAGDCTYHPSVRYGRRVRLESVDNAVEQARTAAANICGKGTRHEHVPWFWSDQYDIKLQIAGLTQGYDQTVLRGDPDSGRFALYYLADGELLAVDAVNSPKDFMAGKKWIAGAQAPRSGRGLRIPTSTSRRSDDALF